MKLFPVNGHEVCTSFLVQRFPLRGHEVCYNFVINLFLLRGLDMLHHSRILNFPLGGHETFKTILIKCLCPKIWQNFLIKTSPHRGYENFLQPT